MTNIENVARIDTFGQNDFVFIQQYETKTNRETEWNNERPITPLLF